MDVKTAKNKAVELIKKYKYAALVLLIGIVLMLMPGKSETSESSAAPASEKVIQSGEIDEDLESILCKIDGAGKVEVMLTVSKGEETIFQTNIDQSQTDNTVNSNVETVIITDSGRNEYGLVTRVDPARYLGAVVLCQGADSPSVRLSIIEAVSKITGLGADRICVLKMK